MACFSLVWLQQIAIWFVILFAVLALLRLVVSAVSGVPFWPLVSWPPAGGASGLAGLFIAALNIVIWAVLAIALIYFVFGLISCLISYGGGFPALPHPHR